MARVTLPDSRAATGAAATGTRSASKTWRSDWDKVTSPPPRPTRPLGGPHDFACAARSGCVATRKGRIKFKNYFIIFEFYVSFSHAAGRSTPAFSAKQNHDGQPKPPSRRYSTS